MFEDLNFEPFKEPKGFLKILQWIFAICAFATTVNFSTTIGFTPICNNTDIHIPPIKHSCEYPFTTDHDIVKTKYCNGTETTFQFIGNEKSNSEFFVATGVLSFIYSTALVAIMLFAEKVYADNPKAPVVDFCITLVLAVFWLSGSAAWAHGRGNLVDAAPSKEVGTWIHNEIICKPVSGAKMCDNIMSGAFGGITISYLFGFINFIIWAANLWFLYKETPYFDSIMKGGGASTAASSPGGI